jgi:methyl-accepting chemotaxis protein
MSSPANSAEDAATRTQRTAHVNIFFAVVLWALFVLSLSLAAWHESWRVAWLVGLPTVLLPSVMLWLAPHKLVTRLSVGAALMIFCALNIQQGHGMIELHFGIFALLALLLFYEDWRVIAAAATVIAVHHLLFTYLQAGGHAMICMPKPSWGLTFLHAVYVVVESAGLCYLAVMLHRKTDHAEKSKEELEAHLRTIGEVVQQAHVGIGRISTAARGLALASREIASGAQEQSASLEETSASLEQITATMRQSTDHVKEASRLAEKSGASAEEGGRVVSDAVLAMSEINTASARISDIIATINEIAFQTNLLAVNAAVEAARAGEEGRGFAVVASEVRSLALRTASAAKEIKTLINDSQKKVARGTELVNRSGNTLEGIVGSVQSFGTIFADLVTAAEEQSLGVEQINLALGQMDQVTQVSSSKTEDLAATANGLSELSAQLMSLVSSLATVDQGSKGSQPTVTGTPSVGSARNGSTSSSNKRSPSSLRKTDNRMAFPVKTPIAAMDRDLVSSAAEQA